METIFLRIAGCSRFYSSTRTTARRRSRCCQIRTFGLGTRPIVLRTRVRFWFERWVLYVFIWFRNKCRKLNVACLFHPVIDSGLVNLSKALRIRFMFEAAILTEAARKTLSCIVATGLFRQVLRKRESSWSIDNPPFGDAAAVLTFARALGRGRGASFRKSLINVGKRFDAKQDITQVIESVIKIV